MATQPDPLVELPCIEIEPLGALPQIPLLGGGRLTALVDIAGGAPTQCKLNFNLLGQVGPLFASMACLFKILNVIAELKKFASVVSDPAELPSAVSSLVAAIDELQTCMPPLQIPAIIAMIKHVLMLVAGVVDCVLQQIDVIQKFKRSLDFNGARGNPTLTKVLTCASNSADAALGNALTALQPLQYQMTVVSMLAGIAGQSFALPDFGAFSTEVASVESTVAKLQGASGALRSIVASLLG